MISSYNFDKFISEKIINLILFLLFISFILHLFTNSIYIKKTKKIQKVTV